MNGATRGNLDRRGLRSGSALTLGRTSLARSARANVDLCVRIHSALPVCRCRRRRQTGAARRTPGAAIRRLYVDISTGLEGPADSGSADPARNAVGVATAAAFTERTEICAHSPATVTQIGIPAMLVPTLWRAIAKSAFREHVSTARSFGGAVTRRTLTDTLSGLPEAPAVVRGAVITGTAIGVSRADRVRCACWSADRGRSPAPEKLRVTQAIRAHTRVLHTDSRGRSAFGWRRTVVQTI